MAQINDFVFDNSDVTEDGEGYKDTANFPNPSSETETRLQLQKLLSQIRYYINNTIKPNINGKVEQTDIVDDLTSTDPTKVLSAKQGKVLFDASNIIDAKFEAHKANVSNPHSVTKAQVGLGNVDNTSDVNKPVSTATQTELNKKVNYADVKDNLTSTDTNKPLSAKQGKVVNDALNTHKNNTSNPHSVTKAQVGLGNVDNTSDLNKPISNATQTALNGKAPLTDFNSHKNNTSNPHSVNKVQLGLGNVNNTADVDKPISNATQTALNAKANASNLTSHTGNTNIHTNVTEKAYWNAKQKPLVAGAFIIIEDMPDGKQKISASNGEISVDYNNTTNKPRINNIELQGNKSLDDFGIAPLTVVDGAVCLTFTE